MYIFLGEKRPFNRNEIYEIPDKIITIGGSEYEIGSRLNSGGNAVVHECLDLEGNEFAVKFLLKFSNKIEKRFEQEIEMLKTISHDHIIKYIDSGVVFTSTEEKKIKFIIMEKADCNLLDYVRDNPLIPYGVYAAQFRGLAEALSILHQKAIHRDIKPENILIKGEKWLISDFGLCQLFDDEYQEITGQKDKIGPRYWMSPEAINRTINSEDTIDKYSDVFQLCAVFWFVINKRHPAGIVSEDDWVDDDKSIFNTIHQSLSHNCTKRPQDGKELFDLIYKATIDR